VPNVTVVEAIQGQQGFDIGAIPATATAGLPAAFAELGIKNPSRSARPRMQKGVRQPSICRYGAVIAKRRVFSSGIVTPLVKQPHFLVPPGLALGDFFAIRRPSMPWNAPRKLIHVL
jgi:hypothetical protein